MIEFTYLFFCKCLIIIEVHFLEGFHAAWSSSQMQKLHLEDHSCIGWHRIYGIKQKSVQINLGKSRTAKSENTTFN